MDRETNGIQRLKVGVSLGVTNMSRVHTGCVQNRGYRVQCSGEDQSAPGSGTFPGRDAGNNWERSTAPRG